MQKFLMLFLPCLLLPVIALAQGDNNEWINPEQQKSINPPLPQWVGYDFSWVNMQWKPLSTEIDLNIFNAFSIVDKYVNTGKSLKQICKLFDQKLKENPSSAYYRVCWAYSSTLISYSPEFDIYERDKLLAKAEWLIRNLPKESIVQLYRLRFLIFSNRLSFNGRPLLSAGNRLVQKYPGDLYVLMHHGYNLAGLSQSASDSDKAIKIANQLIDKSFRTSSCYSAIAMAHWSRIIPEKSTKRAKFAIENYKLSYKFSTSDRGRKGCLEAIEKIKWACKNKGIKYE
jgi:hypothetical protein